MYGQIISFLFVLLILYYVVMILLDIRKAKVSTAAELEKNGEEEIDISDEANNFKPTLITRDDPNRTQTPISTGDVESNPEKDSDKFIETENDGKNPAEDTTTGSKSVESEQWKKTESDKQPTEYANDAVFNENKKPEEKPSVSQETEQTEKKVGEKPFRREGYREPLMTDGLEVGRFLEEAEILAATGKGPLETIVYEIHK